MPFFIAYCLNPLCDRIFRFKKPSCCVTRYQLLHFPAWTFQKVKMDVTKYVRQLISLFTSQFCRYKKLQATALHSKSYELVQSCHSYLARGQSDTTTTKFNVVSCRVHFLPSRLRNYYGATQEAIFYGYSTLYRYGINIF